MMRRWRSLLVSLLIASLFVGVLSALDGGALAQAPKKLKVAMVLPGTVSDKGFNAGGYAGLVRIKEELGFETAFSEGVPRPDMPATFRDYAARGFDILVGHGFPTADAVGQIAREFPNKWFANTFGAPAPGKNVVVIDGHWEEHGHVMGVMAALVSRAGKIGIVAGREGPIIRRQAEAFRLGILAERPNAEVHTIYTGTFYDPVKGKEAATALIAQGVDVLAHMADLTGLGVLEAAREKNILAFGYAEDQRKIAPDQVVSSAVFRSGDMIFDAVKDIAAGRAQAGRRFYRLKDGVLEVGPYGEFVPKAVRDRIGALVEEIKAGKRTIPLLDVEQLMKMKIRKL